MLYQRETENQSWQLPVHVLFLITVEVFMVCLWTSKDVACYNCRHWFYEGVWGRSHQKVRRCHTSPAGWLYTQIPYGIPVYTQTPCLLFLKDQKWPKIANFEENGIFTNFAYFYCAKISFLKCIFLIKNVDLKNCFCIYLVLNFSKMSDYNFYFCHFNVSKN